MLILFNIHTTKKMEQTIPDKIYFVLRVLCEKCFFRVRWGLTMNGIDSPLFFFVVFCWRNIIIQVMDFIPLDCPLPHVMNNITKPQIGEVEAGIAVSVRLKCPHKHHKPHRGWVEFATDSFGNVTWREVPIGERVFYKDRPIQIGI